LPGVTYSSGDFHTSGVAIADVNGDGKPDVLTTGLYTVDVLLGNGDGTLQPAVTYPAGYWQKYLAVADLRGDGKLDVVTAGSYGDSPCGPIVLLGNGDGTFQPGLLLRRTRMFFGGSSGRKWRWQAGHRDFQLARWKW
jgi:hypothetical protein